MKIGRILFIFLVLLIAFNFLAQGFLGVNGYLYNKSLNLLMEQRLYMIDKISIELSSLMDRQRQLTTEQGIKDEAVSLGYYLEGDKVYVFDSKDMSEARYEGNIHDFNVRIFTPYSAGLCLLVAFIPALFFTFLIWFINYLRHRDYIEPVKHQDDFEGFEGLR